MILTDFAILQHVQNESIVIEPFDKKNLGSNSYDVHLSKHLAEYTEKVLDAKKDNPLRRYEIPEDGLILEPGRLYLGSTVERTETYGLVPMLEGKSSTGRLGIEVHISAGAGDDGFVGFWTLEITVKRPVRVYAGMPIAQLTYHRHTGNVIKPYHGKLSAKYANQSELPQGSKMYLNDF